MRKGTLCPFCVPIHKKKKKKKKKNFRDSPPSLSRTPVSFPPYRAGSPRAPALRQGVEALLAKGTLEIALVPGLGFSSRLFLVEKASGSWRPVINLSHLNEFVHLTPFMMVTVASVLLSVREGDFLASLDLKDAYLQIPIPYSVRKPWDSRRRGRLPVRRPVFRTLDRSPGRHYGLCQHRLTRTGSDFSGIWTTGWFLPPRSGQPNRRSSPFSRFVATSGL